MRIAAIVVAVLALLASCSSDVQQTSPQAALTVPVTPASDQAQLDEMARHAPCTNVRTLRDLAGPAQVAEFGAVAVINCHQDARSYPGEGEWSVLVRQVAPTGLAALVSALERPDDPPPSPDTMCMLPGYGPLPFLLADGTGEYLHPRMPTNGCGGPQRELTDAIDDLVWRTVSVTRIEQVQTPESIASGCEMAWKNELRMLAASLEPGNGGPVVDDGVGDSRTVCIYHADQDPDRGDFTRAVTLDGEDARELDLALAGAAPTGECQPQPDFAVVHGVRYWIEAELGGCWRTLRVDLGYNQVGGADAARLKQLLALD